MEKTNTIAAMKVAKHNQEQETVKQSKFGNWWKTKAMPWLTDAFSQVDMALRRIRLPSLRTILVLAILVYMANDGALENMPNTQWLVECSVRLIECIFGAFRWLVELFVVEVLDSKLIDAIDIFGIFELLSNFMKTIFAL